MSNELIPHIAQGELVQIQEATERIQANLKEMDKNNRRNLSLAVETGVELLQVKQQLKHGEFGNWLQDNFSMSRTEATRYMQLGRYFADKLSNLDNLPPLSVAYLLVQTTTPDAVRQAVLSGEIPQTVEAVKEAIAISGGQTVDALPDPDTVEFLQKKLEVATTIEELQALEDKARKMKKSYASQSEDVITDGIAYDMTTGISNDPVVASIEAVLQTGGFLHKWYRHKPLADAEEFAWFEYHLKPAEVSLYMLYASRYSQNKGIVPKQVADELVALRKKKDETMDNLIGFFAYRKEMLPYLMDIARCFFFAKLGLDRKGEGEFNTWVETRLHIPAKAANTLLDLLQEYINFPYDEVDEEMVTRIEEVPAEFTWRCADIYARYEIHNLNISWDECFELMKSDASDNL